MTQNEFSRLTPAKRVTWLNELSPTNSWNLGDDVFCLHCDGVFKAEDVACDDDGYPTCPVCHSSTPLDFAHLPWWRDDLTKEVDGDEQHQWAVKPITAEPGKPRKLPNKNSN